MDDFGRVISCRSLHCQAWTDGERDRIAVEGVLFEREHHFLIHCVTAPNGARVKDKISQWLWVGTHGLEARGFGLIGAAGNYNLVVF
jgi:hypothetical protein